MVSGITASTTRKRSSRHHPDSTTTDLVLRRVNESDASAFSRLAGGPPQLWGVIWGLISVVLFASGLIIGIVAFKTPNSEQRESGFLDTRSVSGMSGPEYVVLRPR